MNEGPLGRWSRRKRAAASPAPLPSPGAPPAAPSVEQPPPAETLGVPELLGWLRRNVPEAWRAAALRRVWVMDPAIRDFVGPADYAWDWNKPGGVPFYGPLRAVDDIGKLLARVAGETDPPARAPATETATASSPRLAGDTDGIEKAAASERCIADDAVPPPAAAGPDLEPLRRRGGRVTPG